LARGDLAQNCLRGIAAHLFRRWRYSWNHASGSIAEGSRVADHKDVAVPRKAEIRSDEDASGRIGLGLEPFGGGRSHDAGRPHDGGGFDMLAALEPDARF